MLDKEGEGAIRNYNKPKKNGPIFGRDWMGSFSYF